MGAGTVQIGFTFHDGRPLCTRCGRRGVRVDAAGHPQRTCLRCYQRDMAHYRRQRARGRRFPAGRYNPTVQLRARTRKKDLVLAALGGRCSCADGACWHSGPCPVTDRRALSVDHQHQNGWFVRRRRRDGTMAVTQQTRGGQWTRYRAELATDDHGLRLLCFNCHALATQRTASTHPRARRRHPVPPADPPRHSPASLLPTPSA